jgi:hypothetical protein
MFEMYNEYEKDFFISPIQLVIKVETVKRIDWHSGGKLYGLKTLFLED